MSWVASQLKYFDKNPRYPSVYLLVCVSQLKSATYTKTDASRDTQFMGNIFASTSTSFFSIPEIPSAVGIVSNVGSTSVFWIIFSKGRYLTVITSQDRKVEETAARQLAANWAVAEYHRLPT
jgi:hypothetical protein